ncbi:hypothetical protein LTS18_008722 [Coniosporium uncinatum]|uniref:Uncharacterized protein n=1 Tax=Coniosporium uncinatum TaxID=93489 RepID=A0ACC3DXC0_9PEZI|nr:hypothetical protein LTS18_008722 [Coniosporium uncinatum]
MSNFSSLWTVGTSTYHSTPTESAVFIKNCSYDSTAYVTSFSTSLYEWPDAAIHLETSVEPENIDLPHSKPCPGPGCRARTESSVEAPEELRGQPFSAHIESNVVVDPIQVTSSSHNEQSVANTILLPRPTTPSQGDTEGSDDNVDGVVGGVVVAGQDNGQAAPAPAPAATGSSSPRPAQTASPGNKVGGVVAGLFGSSSYAGKDQQQSPRNENSDVQNNVPIPEQAHPGPNSVQHTAQTEAPAVTSRPLSSSSPSSDKVAGAAIVGGQAVTFIRTTITRVVSGTTRTIAAVVAAGQTAAPGETILINGVTVEVSALPNAGPPRENVALAQNADTPENTVVDNDVSPKTGSSSTLSNTLYGPIASIANFAALAVALPSSTLTLPSTSTALTANRGQAIVLNSETFIPLWNNPDAFVVDGQQLRQGGNIVLPDKNGDGKPETAYLTTNTLSETVLVLGTQTVVIVKETGTEKGSGTTVVGGVGDYIASGFGGRIVPSSSSAGESSETPVSPNEGSVGVEQSNGAVENERLWHRLWSSSASLCVLLSLALL